MGKKRNIAGLKGLRRFLIYIYNVSALAVAVLTAAVAASCDKAEERYSTEYVCNFTFSTQLRPTSILARVWTNPGMFVRVEVAKRSGVHHVLLYPNNGDAPEDIAMTTAIDNDRIDYSHIGANGSIIVGCTTTNERRGYDAQCPYCLSTHSSTAFPLSWADNGQAVTCSGAGGCGRKYNLNYGASADGHRLIEYRVRYDGNLVTVRNR